MVLYVREHQIDMLIIYGEARKNCREARALYIERYPDRPHPSKSYFPWLENHLKNETVQENNDYIISEDAEINTLAVVRVDKTISLRQISNEIGVSRESARKILKKFGFKSFKYQIKHHLFEADSIRRLNFCNWFINEERRQHHLRRHIIFSDECRFTNIGMFNRHNNRYWANENHHLFREGAFQERFGINVWLGVIGTRIIGPIFFREHLTAELYLNFLQNEIVPFLENFPLNEYVNLYFQQDGAPAHNSRVVVNYLNQQFDNRWIGTNGPVRWPPRSPDLTPLDFFYWAYIKEKVYKTQLLNLEDLINRITEAITSITPIQMENVLRKLGERIYCCIDMNGGHIEHLNYG